MASPRNKSLLAVYCFALLFAVAALLVFLEPPTGSMQGRVLDEQGKPLEGVQVTFEAYPLSRKLKTDKDGRFRIDQLPLRSYYLNVTRRGYRSEYLSDKKIVESRLLDLGDIRLRELEPSLSVSVWNNTKTPEEKIFLSLSGAKVGQVHFDVYQIDLAAYLASGHKLSELEQNGTDVSRLAGAHSVKAWDEAIPEGEIPEFDRKVKAEIPDSGVYVVTAEAASLDRKQVFIQNILLNRTDLGFITKRDSEKIVVYVSSFLKPAPVADAKVLLYPDRGENAEASQALEALTDANGLAEFKLGALPEAAPILGVAFSGTSTAFAAVPEISSEAEEGFENTGEDEGELAAGPTVKRYRTFLYTERPLYRPGQKVYFKGIIRPQDADERYLPPRPMRVSWSVEDPKNNTLAEGETEANAMGSFWGEFELGDSADLGYYRVTATVAGREFSQSFEVDEYRKPEFKVEILPGEPRYFAGDKIEFSIDTQYYFGAPVAADIDYTLYKSSYYYVPPGEGLLPDLWEGEDSYGGYGEYLEEGKGRSDAQGRLKVAFSSQKSEEDQRYTLRVTATDIANRQVKGENSVIVTAGDFFFRTSTAQFLAFPKKPFPLTVIARDYDGKPRAEDFEVRWEREVWDPVARRYDYQKSGKLSGQTRASGETTVDLLFERGGYYRLAVTGKDDKGRRVRFNDSVWVSGSAEDSEDFAAWQELRVIAEKKQYNAGETAKLFIVGPVKNGKVLVSIEGARIHRYSVETLDGFSKTLEIPLPKEWVPNVYVSVTAIGKKEFYEGMVELAVSPREYFLNVEIEPDAQTYRPGGNISYKVSTKDMQGKPVSAEISLGVVDESIYALKADSTDIKNFFWGPRENRVATNYSFSGYYSGGVEKEDQNLLRRNFKDTAYWVPAIQTNEAGEAHAAFTLPDNLTTWRATVLGVTAETAVGQQTNKVIASKELIARIAVPRFFTERDQVRLKAMIHNYTDKPQTLRVTLGLEGMDFANPKDGETTNMTIAAQGVGAFDFTVLPKLAGNAKIQLLAKNAEVSDGVELKVPILPHGIEDHQYAQGEILPAGQGSGRAEVTMAVPPQNDPQRSKIQVTLDTSFVAQLLGPLNYLVNYPYGCVEQTMSRFLPALMISKLNESLGLSEVAEDKKLSKVIAKSLKRLVGYQHADGGWGWWKNDPTDPYMTAYALYGLLRSETLGEKIDPGVLTKAKKALALLLKQTPLTNTYMLGSEATRFYLHYVASLAGLPNEVPISRGQGVNFLFSKALVALSLEAQGKHAEALDWAAQLEAAASCSGTECHLAEAKRMPWSDVELTAWGLQVLQATGSSKQNLKDSMVRWLLAQRQGGQWRQTRETATALYALAEYAKSLPGVKSGVNALLSLNGRELEKVSVSAGHFVRNIPKPQLKTGNNQFGITNLLSTPLYYQSDLLSFSQMENLAPVAEGIRVKREYFRLSGKSGESADSRSYRAEALQGKIKKGDILGVRLTIESDQDLAYLIVEDPFPSGFEMIPEIRFDPKAVYYADSETHDEKIAFFSNYFKQGTYIYNYALRPELAGSFHVMPTQVYEMYQPETRGSGAETRLEVEF
ncbi:MAG TPA: hypothetical protein DF383_10080 [Deltaproteobacteria bacterium]|nr:hypothetical protein [Deltaproteobacteria bacterium]